jgi:hypothetical protein
MIFVDESSPATVKKNNHHSAQKNDSRNKESAKYCFKYRSGLALRDTDRVKNWRERVAGSEIELSWQVSATGITQDW